MSRKAGSPLHLVRVSISNRREASFLLPKVVKRAYNKERMENTTTPNVPQQPLSKKQQRRLAKQERKAAAALNQGVKRSGSRIAFWLIIIAVIGFFVYAIGKLASSSPSDANLPTDIAIAESDHVLGTRDAAVELIEYADFQCPGCAAFYPIVKELLPAYEGKIAYAYRHYPLPQHPHAKIMGRASEAAALQGKFFEMAELIYANQRSWTSLPNVSSVIEGYAKQLQLDMTKFEADLEDTASRDAVDEDAISGSFYGVNSTPTFFLNGTKISLPRNIGEFRALLDNAIANAPETGA